MHRRHTHAQAQRPDVTLAKWSGGFQRHSSQRTWGGRDWDTRVRGGARERTARFRQDKLIRWKLASWSHQNWFLNSHFLGYVTDKRPWETFSIVLLRNNDKETASQFLPLLQYRLSHHQFCAYITLKPELVHSVGYSCHFVFFTTFCTAGFFAVVQVSLWWILFY